MSNKYWFSGIAIGEGYKVSFYEHLSQFNTNAIERMRAFKALGFKVIY